MEPATQSNPILAFMPLILMFVVFYFLMIRPQTKKEKDRQATIQKLKKSDRVVTTGGILGTVVGVKDDVVVLKVGDGDAKMEVLKSAISGLYQPAKA